MVAFISGRPSFHLIDILAPSEKRPAPFPVDQSRNIYFFSARYALAAAIEVLGLKAGDKILVPAYNCGVELDPLLSFGLELEFYKVNKDLLVDLDDFFKRIGDSTKAALVTHFLGFPQPIDEIKNICLENNLFLIEDSAHALLSAGPDGPLGCSGDVSIFSLLKTLPVPNGGVLLLNNPALEWVKPAQEPGLLPTALYVAELLRHRTRDDNGSVKGLFVRTTEHVFCTLATLVKFLVAALRKLFGTNGPSLVRPDSFQFESQISLWGISSVSKKIVGTTDFSHVKEVRRRNYQYLHKYFTDKRKKMLIFTELPDAVCPLFFPLMVENEKQRSFLYQTMKKNGVASHPWWDRFHPQVPWDKFPDAVCLKKKLFGLPIHQDLELHHMDCIISEFENAYQRVEG
ncbi:MAG: aminotransferase class V-fold PLP-dependent enzyme [Clostridiales bacterium]|nr:aminotransferase class V-fold PLP-dependent enzyme [Clostridiales bacterium]